MIARCIVCLLLLLPLNQAWAFCGFYVAKADTRLFNKASKVVLVRDGNRTVLTMANDFQGDVNEFAIVIPVPTFLQREQIHVGNVAVLDHLDAYSSPRLVEHFDHNPCARYEMKALADKASTTITRAARKKNKSLGVTVEATYTVGEYDIVILSAKESSGLADWLMENHYKIPAGAEGVSGSYIKQNMHFFVAKVNLEKHAKLGFNYLRPLQVAYEHNRFMLPIRLGTVNANGPQELFVFALTRKGRVETTNYRTVKLPSDMEVPEYIKTQFADFYRDMFATQVKKENRRAVFLEYAWNMNWCDPCAAEPLSSKELRQLGVFWISGDGARDQKSQGQAQNAFITRLHLRYSGQTFPQDLQFQATGNRNNFQGRFIIQHPWKGDPKQCPQAKQYFDQLGKRMQKRADTLAHLTGWDRSEIQKNIDWPKNQTVKNHDPWWKNVWE